MFDHYFHFLTPLIPLMTAILSHLSLCFFISSFSSIIPILHPRNALCKYFAALILPICFRFIRPHQASSILSFLYCTIRSASSFLPSRISFFHLNIKYLSLTLPLLSRNLLALSIPIFSSYLSLQASAHIFKYLRVYLFLSINIIATSFPFKMCMCLTSFLKDRYKCKDSNIGTR